MTSRGVGVVARGVLSSSDSISGLGGGVNLARVGWVRFRVDDREHWGVPLCKDRASDIGLSRIDVHVAHVVGLSETILNGECPLGVRLLSSLGVDVGHNGLASVGDDLEGTGLKYERDRLATNA